MPDDTDDTEKIMARRRQLRVVDSRSSEERSKDEILYVESFSDYALEPYIPPQMLVPRYKPQVGIGLLVAASGTGKTFLIIDECMRLACAIPGLPVMGNVIGKPKRSVIFVGEGKQDIHQRVHYWVHRNAPAREALERVLVYPYAFGMAEDWTRCTAILQGIEDKYGPIDNIVIDTFSMYSQGVMQREETPVISFLTNCRTYLSDPFNACVTLAHHVGWQHDERLKGSRSFMDTADFVYFLSKDEIGLKLDCHKLKMDIEPPPQRIEKIDFLMPDNSSGTVVQREENSERNVSHGGRSRSGRGDETAREHLLKVGGSAGLGDLRNALKEAWGPQPERKGWGRWVGRLEDGQVPGMLKENDYCILLETPKCHD